MKEIIFILFAVLIVLTAISFVGCFDEELPEDGAEEGTVVRVGTYNIAHGRFAEFDMAKIAAEISKLELDIVGLQEVDRFAARSDFLDEVEILKKELGFEYSHYSQAVALEGETATSGQYGVLILSRYPITEQETVQLPSPNVEQRVLSRTLITVGDREITFLNTHLSLETPALREGQFEIIKNAVEAAELCFLTGDFNVDSPEEFSLVPLSMVNTREAPIVTFPSESLVIDNIFHSPEIELVSSGLAESELSDHYLLYAEFRLPAAAAESDSLGAEDGNED